MPPYTEVADDLTRPISVDLLTDTLGTESSIMVDKPLQPENLLLFKWDFDQRIKILKGYRAGYGTEITRYQQWYDAFGYHCLDAKRTQHNGDPFYQFDQSFLESSVGKYVFNRYTPATAKILNSLCLQANL